MFYSLVKSSFGQIWNKREDEDTEQKHHSQPPKIHWLVSLLALLNGNMLMLEQTNSIPRFSGLFSFEP